MASATTSASRPAHHRAPPSCTAAAVPARTGATDAARVAGRTADHQTSDGRRVCAAVIELRALGKLGEVRLAFLHVGVATFLRLVAHVVEERRVARELLDAGKPVVGGVEPGLEHAQRERAQLEDAPAPGHGLLLQVREWHDLVDEPHLERLLRVVLLAQEPDLARLLLADDAREQAGAVAAVEAADARPGLAEARVVGSDRQVADDVQHVDAADRVARDHGDHRLGQAAELDLPVEDVEAAGARGVDVAVVAPHALVAARAERLVPGAGEDDDADLRVVARDLESLCHLDHGQGTEGVADVGAVDRDLGDPVPGLVEDVLVVAVPNPSFQVITPRAITSTIQDPTPPPAGFAGHLPTRWGGVG